MNENTNAPSTEREFTGSIAGVMDSKPVFDAVVKTIDETSTKIYDMLKDMPYCVFDEIMRQVECKLTGTYRTRG